MSSSSARASPFLYLSFLWACAAGCSDGVPSPREGALEAITGSDPLTWSFESSRPSPMEALDGRLYLQLERVREAPLPDPLQAEYLRYYQTIPRGERRAMPDLWELGILSELDRWQPTEGPMFWSSSRTRLLRCGDRDVQLLAVGGCVEWVDSLGHRGVLLEGLELESPTAGILDYDAAVVGDELLVAWCDRRGAYVRAARRSPEGFELGEVQALDYEGSAPQLVVAGERVHAVWCARRSSTALRVSSCTRPGGAWEKPHTLTETLEHYEFSAATDGAALWVAWLDHRYQRRVAWYYENAGKLLLTRSLDGGRSFAPPVSWNRKSDPKDVCEGVYVVAVPGGAVVHFEQLEAQQTWERMAVSTDLRVRARLQRIQPEELREQAAARLAQLWAR